MLRTSRVLFVAAIVLACAFTTTAQPSAQPRAGYYTSPSLRGDTLVFVSEGDLWRVSVHGGSAQRLTSSPGPESHPILSPDGNTVAFAATYEGPQEVYTMPILGGLPTRITWDGDASPAGWAPDGRLILSTGRYSTLPGPRLVLIDSHGNRELLPLAEAALAAYTPDAKSLIFTRWDKQWSNTKRYKGGWNENLWRFDGHGEATPLTSDFAGTSTAPMIWQSRIYFLSDRDGIMNLWSMDLDGHTPRQESHQKLFDIQAASLDNGSIVYASGANLWLLDLATAHEDILPITLSSDFDQLREHWVKDPLNYLTSAHLSPDGSSAVFTARGEVFVMPAKSGRIVKVAASPTIRYREGRFLPDGKSILTLSTETGETEFWKFPANAEGAPEQWTHDAKVLRWDGAVSPDGHWLAHFDKDQQLWLYDTRTKANKRIAESANGDFENLAWSGDSRWLAWDETADNQNSRVRILNAETGAIETVTSDRFNSTYPAWSTDGKWLYFLSDRNLKTTVSSPWGPREPEPHFDRSNKIYQLALLPDLRSPFLPADELHPDKSDKDADKKDTPAKDDATKPEAAKADNAGKGAKTAPAKTEDKDKKADDKKPAEVKIDFNGLMARLTEVPAPAGNYANLQAADKRLCWIAASDDSGDHRSFQCLDIANKGDDVDTVLSDVKGFEFSLDRKKLLIAQKPPTGAPSFLILDADAKAISDPKALAKATINLAHWTLSTNPREEFRSIYLDAWQMERDYFYDKKMHGVDWVAMRDRYLPLVDRVSSRDELNTVIAQLVAELSALHTFVEGGDARKPADDVDLASLGALLRRDEKAGGAVVEHVYQSDPDLPNTAPPLARPESAVHEGDVITSIDGVSVLSVPDERALLRGKAGLQVLLHVKPATGREHDLIVIPILAHDEANLRYNEWELTRRLAVEQAGKGQIGYVHLRAMGSGDIEQWARDFYPIFDRQGLILDVRHNHGGNIDSWLLSKLLRQAWFYWQPRVGNPSWNQPYAFRGHIVVLCDHETASDGEAFAEGFRRLGLGKVIGMRTWGGEIWLSFDNVQADNGIATASETGVYSPYGKWLIEGHGVDPDIEVDNLPHATASGSDAQLEAALKLLQQQIQSDPRPVPSHPPYPDKSLHPAN
jgi:tricorn protease